MIKLSSTAAEQASELTKKVNDNVKEGTLFSSLTYGVGSVSSKMSDLSTKAFSNIWGASGDPSSDSYNSSQQGGNYSNSNSGGNFNNRGGYNSLSGDNNNSYGGGNGGGGYNNSSGDGFFEASMNPSQSSSRQQQQQQQQQQNAYSRSNSSAEASNVSSRANRGNQNQGQNKDDWNSSWDNSSWDNVGPSKPTKSSKSKDLINFEDENWK